MNLQFEQTMTEETMLFALLDNKKEEFEQIMTEKR